MPQIHWTHQVNGNFGAAPDWTGGVVPGAADAAILDAAGTTAYFVAATAKETVFSIQTAATAHLTVRVGAAAGGFTATAGSGAGANAGTIGVYDGGDFIFGGTILNTGAISLGSTGDATLLSLSAAGALSGAGKVILSNNANNQITAASAATLTNVNNTISGAGTIGGGGLTLVNQAAGVIDASGATNALILNTGAHAIANAGVIEATGAGGLVIDSTIDNTATGSIEVLNGSTVTLNGAAIVGGSLLAGNATHLNLTGFDLSNVTLKTQGSGTIQVNGGTFTGVINQADINVAEGTDLFVSGSLNNAGTISLINNNESENGTQIVLTGSTALEGGGRIVMGGAIPNQNYIDGQQSGLTLTNVNETISGAGNLGVGGLGIGPLTLVNDAMGVIDATDSANRLVITTGGNTTMTNDGVLEGTGAAGLEINVAVNNAGGGRIFALNGSQVDLTDISVTGGVLNTAGTGVIKANGYASLVSVDSKGALAAQDGDVFYLSGTLTNSGVITLAAGPHGASLQMAGVVTLTGGGQVRMVDSGSAPNANAIGGDFYSPGGSLINVNNTISGAGTIGNEGVGGASLATLTNDAAGVIDASDAGTVLTINGVSGLITNAGLMEGTGAAGLVISGGSIKNTGGTILAANGSQVVLNGNASVTGGTLNSAGSGAIYANGAYLTNVTNKANVDLIDGSALYLAGTLTNSGVISLAGDSHGANLFVSGSFFLSGGGSVTMGGATPWNNAIGGSASGQTLINVDNTISGAGTIGGNNLNVVNDAAGVIDATDVSTALTIDNGGAPAATFTNYGLIEATGAAGLAITSTSIHQVSGGTIFAANGSQVVLNAASLTGGTLNSAGSGVVNVDSATFINLTNKANVDLGDGSALYVSGTLTNSGVISLAGAGHGANFFVSSSTFYLTGGGTVALGGATPWNNDIGGAGSGDTLVNVQNTISGAGNIGGNNLVVINGAAGVIDANTSNTLTLNNGGAAVTNRGLMEATGGGNFTISGTSIQNAGGTVLAATGSQVALNNNANITGGTVRTLGTGVININGGNSFSGLTIGGNVSVLDGDVLTLGGAIVNNGVITAQGGGHGGGVGISGAVTLTGTGSVNIGGPNPWDTSMGASGSGAVLTNDSTIQGEGHVGVVLVNGATGVIDGKGPGVGYGLYLDGNSTAIANSGLLEATSGGTLNINDAVTNGSTGKIEANSGTVVVNAAIANQGLMEATGAGMLNIDAGVTSTGAGVIESHGGTVTVNTGVSGALAVDGGVLDLTQSGVSNNVSFLGGGTLRLDQSQSYTGSVAGFSKTGTNALDLSDIGFVNASEASFVENAGGTSGVLTVTNGSVTTHITLMGNYATSKFVTSSDGHGGTKVVDPTAPMSPNVVAPVHAFIGAMAAFGADAGAAVNAAVQTLRSDQPVLVASAHTHGAIA